MQSKKQFPKKKKKKKSTHCPTIVDHWKMWVREQRKLKKERRRERLGKKQEILKKYIQVDIRIRN